MQAARGAGLKLHLKFSDPSKEWLPLSDRFTRVSATEFPFGNVCSRENGKNRSGGIVWGGGEGAEG